tara:strand:+ start:2752 stop:2967 length:216 start_codon:yes stop_codon:yes gene_type:complete
MNSDDKENMVEEIRQLVNKSGCPELLPPLLIILGLEEDYESESESSSESDEDEFNEELIVVKKLDGFYELK